MGIPLCQLPERVRRMIAAPAEQARADTYFGELPYPPSINRYYRTVRGRILISKAGREYRRDVLAAIAPPHSLEGKLCLRIDAYPPDRRRRDVDNLQKPLLDAMEKAGVFENDAQIKSLTTEMHDFDGAGRILFRVGPLLEVE